MSTLACPVITTTSMAGHRFFGLVQDGHPILSLHAQVGEHQIDFFFFEDVYRLLSIFRNPRRIPTSLVMMCARLSRAIGSSSTIENFPIFHAPCSVSSHARPEKEGG